MAKRLKNVTIAARRAVEFTESIFLRGFFMLKLISLPLFYLIFHYAFVGYFLSEVPIHAQDFIYQTNRHPAESFAIVAIESLLVYTALLIGVTTPVYAITKIISYFIAISTIPVVSLSLYIFLWLRGYLGDLVKNPAIPFYLLFLVSVASTSISLMPPFCRRRAHLLMEMYAPVAKVWKVSTRLFLLRPSSLLSPVVLTSFYALVVWSISHFMNMSEQYVVVDLCGRWLSLSLSTFLRYIAAVRTFKGVFNISVSNSSLDIAAVHVILVASVAVEGLFSIASSLNVKGCGSLSYFFFMIVRMAVEWFVPFVMISIYGGFEKAGVAEKKRWALENKHFFLTAETGKSLIFVFTSLFPFTVIYAVLGTRWKTTSESSQFISLNRILLSLFYAYMDSACKTVFVGKKLNLPELPWNSSYFRLSSEKQERD